MGLKKLLDQELELAFSQRELAENQKRIEEILERNKALLDKQDEAENYDARVAYYIRENDLKRRVSDLTFDMLCNTIETVRQSRSGTFEYKGNVWKPVMTQVKKLPESYWRRSQFAKILLADKVDFKKTNFHENKEAIHRWIENMNVIILQKVVDGFGNGEIQNEYHDTPEKEKSGVDGQRNLA